MIENFKISSNGLRITNKAFFSSPIAELKCAVCPECGYSEMYVDDLKKIKDVSNNKE
jgi:hypothetical protein